MKMSERYQYTILCEDRQTEQFLRRILELQKIPSRKIRIETAEAGVGSAEAFVRREYPRQLGALRKSNFNRRALIVCTDADKWTIGERKEQLKKGPDR